MGESTIPVNDHAQEPNTLRWMLGCSAVLLVASALFWLHSRGIDLRVTSNAEAQLAVDDNFVGIVKPNSPLVLKDVPFGKRTLRFQNSDYETLVESVPVGWLLNHSFQAQLQPRHVRLRVNTAPKAEVIVDGASAGFADSNGAFTKEGFTAGVHQVVIRLSGYSDWTLRGNFRPEEARVNAYLQVNPEKAREVADQRQKVNLLIAQGRSRFAARQYQPALQSLEEALRIDPSNAEAQALRNRVQETLKILQ